MKMAAWNGGHTILFDIQVLNLCSVADQAETFSLSSRRSHTASRANFRCE